MSVTAVGNNFNAASLLAKLVAEAQQQDRSSLPSYAQEVAGLAIVSDASSSNLVSDSTLVDFSNLNPLQASPSNASAVISSGLTQLQAYSQGGLLATNIDSSDSESSLSRAIASEINIFLGKVKAGTVTAADLAQMQIYAQGVSGFAVSAAGVVSVVRTNDGDDDSSQVNISNSKIFLSKVRAGSVTKSDLAQLQERLSRFDAQHDATPQFQQRKPSTESSESWSSKLRDELGDSSPLPSYSPNSAIKTLLAEQLSQSLASSRGKITSNQTTGQDNNDYRNNPIKPILVSRNQAYSFSKMQMATQDLRA